MNHSDLDEKLEGFIEFLLGIFNGINLIMVCIFFTEGVIIMMGLVAIYFIVKGKSHDYRNK